MDYSTTSICRKVATIHEFFKFLYTERVIKNNPALYLLSPKKEKSLPKFLTQKEVLKIINVAESSSNNHFRRIGVMMKLMYACGLRVSELITLKANNINKNKKQILIKGKGDKERIVPIASSALEALNDYYSYRESFLKRGRESIWLFPSYSKYGHLTRDAFYKDVKKLAMEAGIEKEKISPHVLRHSFATHLLNNDVNLRSIQKLLGHSDIATTEIYTHITSKKIMDEVRTKHPLAKIDSI